jgi:hypothetical protein
VTKRNRTHPRAVPMEALIKVAGPIIDLL